MILRRAVRDPWRLCVVYGVAALSLCVLLLLPLSARAQPAGDGWQVGVSCGPGEFTDAPFPAPPASALLVETATVFADGYADPVWRVAINGEPGQMFCFGGYYRDPDDVLMAATVWFRWLPSGEPEPPASGASGPAFDWSSSAHVLQLMFWSFVPLIGFSGYSMGARE